MSDFVTFELAKKLREKGFNCEYPFAMYNKYEPFCPLYSSDKDCFGIDDFDKHACIAPTISQALKWLREEKKLHIMMATYSHYPNNTHDWGYEIINLQTYTCKYFSYEYASYEAAAIAGIEYVIDNLI